MSSEPGAEEGAAKCSKPCTFFKKTGGRHRGGGAGRARKREQHSSSSGKLLISNF